MKVGMPLNEETETETVMEMDTKIRVQILDKTVCISHSVNTMKKDMNLTILPPVRNKQ